MENIKKFQALADGFTNIDSAEQEKQIIVDVIYDWHYITQADRLRRDFFTDGRQEVWDYLTEQRDGGKTADIATTCSKFPHVGEYLSITPAYSDVDFIGHADALIEINKKKATQATAAKFLQYAAGKPQAGDVYDIASDFLNWLENITSKSGDIVSIKEALAQLGAETQAEEEARAKGETSKISTGLQMLDGVLWGGFAPGNLIILAGRPGMGKTSIALQLARNAAEQGKATLFYSLEMTNSELARKLALGTEAVTSDNFVKRMNWEAWEGEVFKQLSVLPLYVSDSIVRLTDIKARTIIEHDKDRADIVFIDQTHLIETDTPSSMLENYRIGTITRGLKLLAKRCNIPIVLLCELKRDAANSTPKLADLKDSGNIEQDADIVLAVVSVENGNNGDRDLSVLKNRHGKAGATVPLACGETFSKFEQYNG